MRLKPNDFSASSVSGGDRNRPSFGDCPFLTSRMVVSKFVNTTSPFSSDLMTGTAAGTWARISDRIIDCPVKVMLNVGACAHAGPAKVKTPRQPTGRRSRAHLD